MKFRIQDVVIQWWKSFEKHPTLAWGFSILWLLLISLLAFLWHLGSIGLVDETEPLFAEAARQMTVTGDWITPYFNSQTRFDKPPLIYWLMASAYNLIGVNEWAVRLPSALSAIALMVVGFYTLRRFGISRPAAVVPSLDSGDEDSQNPTSKLQNQERQLWLSAWIGSALIALNPQTIVWARTGVSDMLLSGCMCSALLTFFMGYASQPQTTNGKTFWLSVKDRWYLAFYVLIALAILAKGPVGIVLPALIIGSFLLYLGNGWDVLREMRLIPGLFLILLLALPWYVLVILANGDAYIKSFFGYHNLQRFTDTVNGHSAPWYFYFLVVLIGFAPWSSYLPLAIARLRFWQRDRWRSSPRSTHLGLFALFWFAGVFGFFTIAVTKLPSYVLPLLPAASILVALLWSDQLTNGGKRGTVAGGNVETSDDNPRHNKPRFSKFLLWSGWFNVVFLLIIAAALVLSPKLIGFDPAAPHLPALLRKSGLPVIGGVIWGTAAIVTAILLWGQRQRRWLWSTNLIGMVAFIIFVVTPASFLMDSTRQQPLRELSAMVKQVARGNEQLIMIGFKKPSVVFYTQRPVFYFDRPQEAMRHIKKVVATQTNPRTFLILTEPKRLRRTKLQPREYTTLGNAGSYTLVRVSKQILAHSLTSETNVS